MYILIFLALKKCTVLMLMKLLHFRTFHCITVCNYHTPFIVQCCRNAEFWPNPLAFKPERFMENDHDMYMFLPFLMGSRMCIGYRFAMMEMKVALSELLRNFKFEHIPGTYFRRKQAITMRPDPPVKLRVSSLYEE